MRILHILDHSAPLQSGYVTRTLGIMRAQAALGLQVAGLTSPRHGAEAGPPQDPFEDVQGQRFYRTPEPTAGFWPGPIREMATTERRLLQVIREFRPDVLHAHSPSLNAMPAIRAGRRAGIPAVYEIRAFWEDAAVDRGTTKAGSAKYRATRMLETRAVRKAAHVFTICDGLRADIADRGIAPERLSVAPNAIDLNRYTPIAARDEALAAELALTDRPVLGFIGSFYHYEGLPLLIEAFSAIKAQHPGARLLFVGGGPEDQHLRQLAAAFGNSIIFTGRVSPEAVPAHYSLIDLLVYPRLSIRLTELVTPLKPLEAMALGRSFIASNIGGHRELIADGVTGNLFAPDDAAALAKCALAALEAQNSDASAQMRAKALEFVRSERSWESVAQRYLPIYDRLTA